LFAPAQEGIYNAGVQMTTGFRSCETGEFYDVISPSETENDFYFCFSERLLVSDLEWCTWRHLVLTLRGCCRCYGAVHWHGFFRVRAAAG
jgi:hypothetical protein